MMRSVFSTRCLASRNWSTVEDELCDVPYERLHFALFTW